MQFYLGLGKQKSDIKSRHPLVNVSLNLVIPELHHTSSKIITVKEIYS